MIRFIRITAAVLAIFLSGNLVRLFGERDSGMADCRIYRPVSDTLTASINIKSGMYTSKGFLTGFQYTMLTAFADTLGCIMNFSGVYEHRDCWEMLSDRVVDIVAVTASDTVPEMYAEGVVYSMPFGEYAWAVRSEDISLLRQVNNWLGLTVRTPGYAEMEKRFFRPYSLERYINSGTVTDRISPYDRIVKEQSRLLGWDWRLLSAVIFKESRFSMGAYSRRGAVGLMQVKRSTAAVYGITDLFNPEENVKAGVRHLQSIQARYKKRGIDSANLVKFTLAAYNAGESRIEDCMNFTKEQGRDCRDWNAVEEMIPLMSLPEYYSGADYLKHGKFNGKETLRYVKDVLSKYEEYLSAVR